MHNCPKDSRGTGICIGDTVVAGEQGEHKWTVMDIDFYGYVWVRNVVANLRTQRMSKFHASEVVVTGSGDLGNGYVE